MVFVAGKLKEEARGEEGARTVKGRSTRRRGSARGVVNDVQRGERKKHAVKREYTWCGKRKKRVVTREHAQQSE
ncbi:hypothetical protein AMTR_s00050p00036800 [Amborella trichopoda]|uniref:Uncharacterized protein n=1 Tax=Amborella trichopoda TaxID=13333 RepID=W1PXW2_AMBTC|nr:hypothetical protein AMTR_s00050p00036800 [Amborella trichopoda]